MFDARGRAFGARGRAAGTRLVGDALGEKRGRFVAGESEAFLHCGKHRDEVGGKRV